MLTVDSDGDDYNLHFKQIQLYRNSIITHFTGDVLKSPHGSVRIPGLYFENQRDLDDSGCVHVLAEI